MEMLQKTLTTVPFLINSEFFIFAHFEIIFFLQIISMNFHFILLKFIDLDDNSCPINMTSYSDNNNNTTVSSQKQKKFLQLLSNSSAMFGANTLKSSSTSLSSSSASAAYYNHNNGNQPKNYSGSSSSSSSASSLADIDDITIVKEEPLSPHSSCPPSPNSNYGNVLPSISSINPDLMYDRKVNQLFLLHLITLILIR